MFFEKLLHYALMRRAKKQDWGLCSLPFNSRRWIKWIIGASFRKLYEEKA